MKNRLMARGVLSIFIAALLCVQASALPKQLIPGGNTVGIKLYSQGLLVSGLAEDAAAEKAGLRTGDAIIAVNGEEVRSPQALADTVQSGEPVALTVLRAGKEAQFFVEPNKTAEGYCLGAYIRDSIAGIGTVTFYDPETGAFGALGHGVNETGGTQLLALKSGILVRAAVGSVKKGSRGTPGQLQGQFDVSSSIGTVCQNTEHGIFGQLATAPQADTMPVAEDEQIHTGSATILANVDGNRVEEYNVCIDRLYPQAKTGRNLLLTVTDQNLLDKTGGIVQGMCVRYNRDNRNCPAAVGASGFVPN